MRISLHLKNGNFFELFQTAQALNLDFFQCFLLDENDVHFDLDKNQIDYFRNKIRPNFKELYAHASYKINLMSGEFESQTVLKKELELCKNLSFTHIVFHPGSRNGYTIDNLAKILNYMCKKYPELIFLLENTAFYNAFGCKLEDFQNLFDLLCYPEKVKICIDTAHAYAAGYDIRDEKSAQNFFCELQKVFCTDQIDLIHLNDTNAKLGSMTDDHQLPGNGAIGLEALRNLTKQQIFKCSKIIFEPAYNDESDIEILKTIIDNLKVELC